MAFESAARHNFSSKYSLRFAPVAIQECFCEGEELHSLRGLSMLTNPCSNVKKRRLKRWDFMFPRTRAGRILEDFYPVGAAKAILNILKLQSRS